MGRIDAGEDDVGVGFDWGFDWVFDWVRTAGAVPLLRDVPCGKDIGTTVACGTCVGGSAGGCGSGINCGDSARYCSGSRRIESCLRESSISMGEPCPPNPPGGWRVEA